MFLATMRQMYERALPISSKKMCCKMPSLRWMTTMTASKFIGPVEVKASPLTPFITGAGCTMACFPLPNKRGWPWSGFGWMGPTQAASNWTSASPLITGAYGTPTLPNSQSLPETGTGDELISIPNARLSPDGDNYEDFLEIVYKLPQTGYAASLKIFDSDGNLVKNLVPAKT
jgi:hypothetical protein